MTVAIFAFTSKGKTLAEKLGGLLAAKGTRIFESDPAGGTERPALAERAAGAFAGSDALIFIGAAGIAVRVIAPLLRSKESDPALVVIDEAARWAIPLVSGHIGGANALAKEIASLLGAEAVITTATDVNGVFAIDLWARRNGLCITSFPKAKTISALLLEGVTVPLQSDYPIAGPVPEGISLVNAGSGTDIGVLVSARKKPVDHPWLRLVPRIMHLGIGCRKGTGADAIAAAAKAALAAADIDEAALASAGTIDIKKDEAGLAAFCGQRGLPLTFFSAQALMKAEGNFSSSAFVESTTGADNVCERAAVLASEGGKLAAKKFALDGVTIAVAEAPLCLRFAFDEGARPWN